MVVVEGSQVELLVLISEESVLEALVPQPSPEP
jgi:hypothetical protein